MFLSGALRAVAGARRSRGELMRGGASAPAGAAAPLNMEPGNPAPGTRHPARGNTALSNTTLSSTASGDAEQGGAGVLLAYLIDPIQTLV